MKMMKQKLIDTNEIGGVNIIDRTRSIFNNIFALNSNPFEWLTQKLADEIDVEYYLNHSGQKTISPMFRTLIKVKTEDDVVDYPAVISKLAKIIADKFTDKWNKLYESFINGEYNPLDNYNMEEVETPNLTHDSTEKTKTKIETETENEITEERVHGFNSTEPVPSGESEKNGKVTVSGGADDNEVSTISHDTGTRALKRHGNIGVTLAQRMLQAEIDLRTNFNFVDMLMKDVDSVLTLDIYC